MIMQMAETHHKDLLARVMKLERQNRFLRTAGFLVALVLGLSLTANVTAQEKARTSPLRASTVEARTFVLKDASGTVRGRMTVDDGESVLELFDATGKVTWSTGIALSPISPRL
jgi:hypothetical protein